MRLPVFAEVIIGSSVNLALTVKNASGTVQSSPTIGVVAQHENGEAFNLDIDGNSIVFEPENVGVYRISIRVTSPVKAVREGLIRVSPSVIA